MSIQVLPSCQPMRLQLIVTLELESWLRKENGRYSWKWLKMQTFDLQKHTKWIVFKYSLWNIMKKLLHHTAHGALLCYLKMNLDSCGAFWHVASISPSQLSQAEGELHPAQLTSWANKHVSAVWEGNRSHRHHQPRPPRCELIAYIVPLDFL